MKTIGKIFVLLAFLFTTHFAAAQVAVGIKGGLNLANVKAPEFINSVVEFQQIQMPLFGVVSEFGIHENFAFQTELNYTTKGFMLDENFDLELFNVPVPIGATAISRFNYLEVPVLAKAKFGNEKVEGYVFAGPTLGYAVDGRLITRAKVLIEFDVFDTDLDLDNIGYERFEVAGTIGAGVAFKTGSGKLFLDGRYNHGFTEVYDVPLISERVENRNINIAAGYMWNF